MLLPIGFLLLKEGDKLLFKKFSEVPFNDA